MRQESTKDSSNQPIDMHIQIGKIRLGFYLGRNWLASETPAIGGHTLPKASTTTPPQVNALASNSNLTQQGGTSSNKFDMALKAESILLEEFKYASAAANQAKADRISFFNFYLLMSGLLATALGAIYTASSFFPSPSSKDELRLLEVLLLAIAGILSFAFYVNLFRLAEAYRGSINSMVIIKNFYIKQLNQQMPQNDQEFSQCLVTTSRDKRTGINNFAMGLTMTLIASICFGIVSSELESMQLQFAQIGHISCDLFSGCYPLDRLPIYDVPNVWGGVAFIIVLLVFVLYPAIVRSKLRAILKVAVGKLSTVAPSVSRSPNAVMAPASSPRVSTSSQPRAWYQPRLSRRTFVLGLLGLVSAGSGIIWLIRSRTAVVTYLGHSVLVNAVAWSPNSMHIASGDQDWTVRVWDAATGENVFTYRKHSNSVNVVAWLFNGTRIASASNDNTVQVWDSYTGNNVLIYRGHSADVLSMAWSSKSHKGICIVSGDSDGKVYVWNATTGNLVYSYPGHSGPGFPESVKALTWSPDGKRIASAGYYVQVWDATTGDNVFSYQGHEREVTVVAWSPDGKYIASGSYDDTVKVWDATTGSTIYTYPEHSNIVTAVAWSPNSKRIASGSVDETVQVWDATTGENAYTYHGHSSGVTSVAWSPDGTHIISVYKDGKLQVWNAT